VTVKTTLGPAATPLSVFVSIEVPRLVVGAASDAPCPSPLETKAETEPDDDDTAEAAAAAAGVGGENGYTNGYKNRYKSRYGNGLPLRFPPTQVGEWREVFVEVANPADVPVRVQIASALGEPGVWTEREQATEAVIAAGVGADNSLALEMASSSLAAPPAADSSGDAITAQAGVRTGKNRSPLASDGASTPAEGEATPGAFHVRGGGSAPEVLPPGGRTILGPVRFAPSRDGLFSAHVYLLNNLTHVE
ncbi:unnamed protein product, partial [Laminaria digitata]